MATMTLLTLTSSVARAAKEGAHPCSQIIQECRKKGYAPGGARNSGRGMPMDCLRKVIAGNPLPGLSLRFETVGACKKIYAAQEKSKGSVAKTASAKKTPTTRRLVPSAKKQPKARPASISLIERHAGFPSSTSDSGTR